MTVETIHTISSIIADLVLIITGVLVLNTAWSVRSWYKKKFEDLDSLEERIYKLQIEQQTVLMNKIQLEKRYTTDDVRYKNKEVRAEMTKTEIEHLETTRKHIIDRMPFTDFFKK